MAKPMEVKDYLLNVFAGALSGYCCNFGEENDPVDMAVSCIEALEEAGWGLVYPENFPGLCGRCRSPIEPGTAHVMFNGNQMFACQIVPEAQGYPAILENLEADAEWQMNQIEFGDREIKKDDKNT